MSFRFSLRWASTLRYATAAQAVPRSGIREIMDLAWELERTNPVIHLEVGQPNFDTPRRVLASARAALDQPHLTKYAANAGLHDLRLAAAASIQGRTGVETTLDNVIITHGGVMACATAFMSVLNPGDAVLLPDPSWPNYNMAARLCHAKPLLYPMRPENEFIPRIEDLEALVTPDTKLLVVNSPCNPTGQVLPSSLLADLMAFSRRHDLHVLSDEIYADICFQPHHSTSPSMLPHDQDGRCILVSGLSKSHSMTGFRIGFLRGNPEFVQIAAKLQEPFVSCGVPFAQHAAITALKDTTSTPVMTAAYKARRDLVLAILENRGMFSYRPMGAFYILIDIARSGTSAHNFALRLLREKNVAVAPGSCFGQVAANFVRVSLASSESDVSAGVSHLCDLVLELEAASPPRFSR